MCWGVGGVYSQPWCQRRSWRIRLSGDETGDAVWCGGRRLGFDERRVGAVLVAGVRLFMVELHVETFEPGLRVRL